MFIIEMSIFTQFIIPNVPGVVGATLTILRGVVRWSSAYPYGSNEVSVKTSTEKITSIRSIDVFFYIVSNDFGKL
jgi:hypothetical protein